LYGAFDNFWMDTWYALFNSIALLSYLLTLFFPPLIYSANDIENILGKWQEREARWRGSVRGEGDGAREGRELEREREMEHERGMENEKEQKGSEQGEDEGNGKERRKRT
jgi:hypothetical protein